MRVCPKWFVVCLRMAHICSMTCTACQNGIHCRVLTPFKPRWFHRLTVASMIGLSWLPRIQVTARKAHGGPAILQIRSIQSRGALLLLTIRVLLRLGFYMYNTIFMTSLRARFGLTAKGSTKRFSRKCVQTAEILRTTFRRGEKFP